ncbi:MAG: hypothetical protein LBU89_11455, partial [Fibromonadaceae bacterium]|nr:hypothetical protein [Fibromonadaceae bacterium]
ENRTLSIADSLFQMYSDSIALPPFLIACSIRASIEQEPNGEYALSLNSTRYRLVKLSDNHYVLRKVEI